MPRDWWDPKTGQANGSVGEVIARAHHLHFRWHAARMPGRTGLPLQTARTSAQRFGGQGDRAGEARPTTPASRSPKPYA